MSRYLMDDITRWKAVYRLLDRVNTEVFDCGSLCGSACCMCYSSREYADVDAKAAVESGRSPLCFKDISLKEDTAGTVYDGGVSDEDMGIYLFPGEHLLLQRKDIDTGWLTWDKQDPHELGFPPSWTGPVYFVKCKTPPVCPRKWRPLQCRTFPLKPVFADTGVLELIWNDEDLPYVCPLIEQNAPIHDDFYKATYTVWSHLLKDRRIFDLIMMWS